MLFVARTAFWLGLVFTQLPWSGSAPPSGSPAPALASGALTALIERLCLESPQDCVDVAAAQAGRLMAPAPSAPTPAPTAPHRHSGAARRS